MTQLGVILGTAAYMSPEQAKGRQADKRSDIWAFGCVLYEMLTGQRAFKGDDVADTLAAVLRQDIDWTALPASTPASVRRLIARCLDRDVRRRLRDIGEARIVLDDPAALARRDAGERARRSRRRGPCGDARFRSCSPRSWPVCSRARHGVPQTVAGAPRRHSIPVHAPRGPGVHRTGRRQLVAISPDGAQMVYAANTRLYLRSMSELEARAIPGTERHRRSVTNPVFSPDGRSVAFWSSADQTLKRIAVTGGAAVTICPADRTVRHELGHRRDRLRPGQQRHHARLRERRHTGRAREREGRRRGARPADAAGRSRPCCSRSRPAPPPIGGTRRRSSTQSLRSGERKTLIDGGSDARYVPTGHLVYALGGVVFAVPIRPSPPGGDRRTRADRRRRQASGRECHRRGPFAFSSTGSLVYVPARSRRRRLSRISR